jgi:hypothetical protein
MQRNDVPRVQLGYFGRVDPHVYGIDYDLLTDVSGEPFWTIVAEARVGRIDDFFAMERQLMSTEALRTAMADYHELVESGRREIYQVESE